MGYIVRGSWKYDKNGKIERFVKDSNGLPYFVRDPIKPSKKRKPYTRKHPYPNNTTHFKPLPNEKASIIKLRRLGYSITHISKALGRSTSFIHRIIKKAETFNKELRFDKRKLPSKYRLLQSKRSLKTLFSMLSKWEKFIFKEELEPP